MMRFPLRMFLIAGLLLTFCVGCSSYNYESNAVEVTGLSSGELALPGGSFDYYTVEALRYNAYVFYFKDRSFFDLNETEVAVALKGIKIKSGTSRDMTVHFEGSPYSLPFNYGLIYDYIQLNTGDPLVEADALFSEEHGVYMLRIMNFKAGG